jgi:hypothetical protein
MAQADRSVGPSLSRRAILGGGVAIAAAGIWWQVSKVRHADVGPLLTYVSDQTIPATETPGAVAVKVPEFVQLALAHGLAGAKGDELERLAAELDAVADGDFMGLAATERLAALTRHDNACFASRDAASKAAWPLIKKLILMGYYTSEVGGSQELAYELSPGEYRGDIAYAKGDRAYSNNWFGVMI